MRLGEISKMRKTFLLLIMMTSPCFGQGACPAGTPISGMNCFFVSANGADTNNGTSESTPWLHAPGMPNCSDVCAGNYPAAGSGYIFRGGDTWHWGTGTSLIGGQWNWNWSGSSGSPIYIGVDLTWYSGNSWSRPILNMDNLPSTSFVSNCSYDDAQLTPFSLNNVNYVTVDNFEFTGMCVASNPVYGSAVYFYRAGTYIQIENCYFHGWTEVQATGNDYITMISGDAGAKASNNIVGPGNVIDGSDSHCAGVYDCTGLVLYADAYDVHDNVFRWVANGLNTPGNVSVVHDNLFEYIYESYDSSVHSGVIESNGGVTGQPISIYNNIFRNVNSGVTLWPESIQANTYIFNNIFYGIDNPQNCIVLDGQGDSGIPINVYITNNTFDSPCNVRFFDQHAGQEFNGAGLFQNNYFIGYSTQTLSSVYSLDDGVDATVTDNGDEVFQTESVANGQGYTATANYQPTSNSGATVNAGGNLSASCSMYSADSALCNGTTGGVTNAVGTGTIPALYIPSPSPRGSAWDVGAYESSSSASRPDPPTNLTGIVQVQ